MKVEGYDVNYCIAVRKGDAVLLARINEGLALLKSTGKFDELYRKWFGFVAPVGYTAVQILLAVAVGLAIALGVAVWAVARQRSQGQRITLQAESLRASETRLRAIIATEPECVKLLAPDGSLLEMNPAGLRMIEAESFLQVDRHCLYPLVVEEHRAAFKALNEKVFTGESGILEFQVVGLKGGRRWLETHASPLRDASGKITALLGITRDITGRKAAEEERDRLFNLSLDMLCVAGLDGFFKQLNPAWSRTLGWSDAELLRQPWLEFVHPDDRDGTVKSLAKLAADNPVLDFVNRYRCKDGSYRWISWNSFPLPAEGLAFAVARDITARMQAEAALRESEERLRLVLDGLGPQMFVGLLDTEGVVLVANRPALEAAGLRLEAVLGQPVHETYWFTYSDAVAQRFRAAVQRSARGETVRYDEQIRVAEGQLFWVAFTVQPVRDASGKIAFLVPSAVVIHERKLAEAALRESERQLRLVTDHAPVFIAHCDRERRYKFVNQPYAGMFGLRATEVVGKHAREVLGEAAYAQASPHMEAALAGQAVEYDLALTATAGAPRVLHASYVPERGASGSVVGFIAAITDITTRQQAEDALRESHARLKKVLEVETVGVMFWDLTTGCMTDANDTFLKVMGYSRRDVEARELTWQKLTPPEYVEVSLAEIRKFQATGRVGPYEKEYLRKDGTRQWFVFAGSSLGENTCVEFCVDITAHKQAEATLSESEERYRALFENMAAGFVLFEVVQDDRGVPVDLVIITANAGFEQTTGLKNREAIGQRLTRVLPGIEKDAAGWIGIYGQVALTGKSRQLEQGSELLGIYYSVTAYQSGPKQCAVTFVNITARKQAEAALREADARLRLSVAASNIGLWDWNLVTNEVYFSREWKGQLGYAEDEMSNRFDEWESRVHPDDLAPTLAKVRAFIADPAAHYAVEFRLRHKDGSYRWIFTQAQILRDPAGQPARMVGCHLDITERKRTEARLHASHAQLRALAARLQIVREEQSKHLAREIHDVLGQQLTALKLDLAWLKRRAAKAADAALGAALGEKLAATSALVDTAMGTVQTIATELRPSLLDKLGLAAALEHEAREFAERTGLACQLDLRAARFALGDEQATGVFRIFQEALTNIARHAHATEVRVRLARDAAGLVLEVRDNGCGLPDAQLHGAKSLGLLGMNERARLLSGALDLRGVAGAGTTVTLTVPLEPVTGDEGRGTGGARTPSPT